MRFDAAALAADKFRYATALPDGRTDEIVLGRSGGVTGFYEYEAAHVVDASATTFEVALAVWNLETARIAANGLSRLDGVKLLLRIPTDDTATTLHLELAAAAIDGLAYTDGDLSITGKATLEGVVVALAEGKVTVTATRVVLEGVRIASSGLVLEIVHLEANAVLFRDGHIELQDLALTDATVSYPFPPATAAAPAAAKASGALPDLPLLDQLEGNVAIDAKVIVAVPILGEKKLDQPLRIPIANGAISFADLEHGLSCLEDAALDFEVRSDELVLELDLIPIVKFDNRTIVSWSLVDSVDRDLAKQKRVRLRRLVQYRLPPAGTPKKPPVNAKKGFRLTALDFTAIDVALAIPKEATLALGGGTIALGTSEAAAVESLTAKGELHVAIEGESRPGRIDLGARGIHALVSNVALGPVTVVNAQVDVALIDSVRADFMDVTPQKVIGTVREGRIQALVLDVKS